MSIATLPALAAVGAALLIACTSSSTGPEALGSEGFLEAEYTVLGDTLVLQSLPDTIWSCDDTVKTMRIEQYEPNSYRFTVSGNTLRLFLGGPDTIWGLGDQVDGMVDRYSRFSRIDGGQGLEGRWIFKGYGYDLLSGTVNERSKKNLEFLQNLYLIRSQYVTEEYEFSDGKMIRRNGGDFAGLYVASWNGAFRDDSLDVPDSAIYDIEATRMGPGSVRLKGRKTGETVTLTLSIATSVPIWTYASDNPSHPTYPGSISERPCTVREWFRTEFLAGNQRAGHAFKRGVAAPGRDGFPGAWLDRRHGTNRMGTWR